MSVAKLTSEYKKFLGHAPNNGFSARCYASQFLHDPATGWSHTPDDIALATNQPKQLISTFCDHWLTVARMSVDDLLSHWGGFENDSFVEAFFRQRLASETVLRTHIEDIYMRVMHKKTASHLSPLLRSAATGPKGYAWPMQVPSWLAENYLGESVRHWWEGRPRVCRVEVIDKVEAAVPALGCDPQWLLTKAKRLTRARLAGKQHQTMRMAAFSGNDDERRWATFYMNLVDLLEATP